MRPSGSTWRRSVAARTARCGGQGVQTRRQLAQVVQAHGAASISADRDEMHTRRRSGDAVGRGVADVDGRRGGDAEVREAVLEHVRMRLGPRDVVHANGQIEKAVESYPYRDVYRTWPGPNSNTFVAHVARSVPDLRLELPPTAIGKDFLPNGDLAGRAPSGTGFQLSLYGVFGVLLALHEGVELNLLGLSFGVDVGAPAIKLPGLGRIGIPK